MLIHRLGTCHDSDTVTDALQTMVTNLPRAVRASITWDQGSKMAQHARFTTVTDTQVQAVQDRLNRRPRLVLKGQNPSETFNGANTT